MSFSLEVFAQNIDINTPINIPSRKLYFAYGQTYKVKLDRTFSRLAKEGFNNFYFVGIERQFNEKILNIQSVLLIGTLKTRGNRFNPLNNYAGAIKIRIMRQSKKLSKSDFAQNNIIVDQNAVLESIKTELPSINWNDTEEIVKDYINLWAEDSEKKSSYHSVSTNPILLHQWCQSKNIQIN